MEVIKRAGDLIASKTGYVGGGMEGYAVLSLIDENGYPTSSVLTIVKAEGINWLTFATSPDSNKAKRIAKCSSAGVCIASSEYNISLVGTIEIVTDLEAKKDMWLEPMNDGSHWSGYDDPNFCVLKFNTERYNICFADDDSFEEGVLKSPANSEGKRKLTPGLGFKGQCAQATELYKKAFGAISLESIRYADANPKDLQCKEEEKDFIFYSEMVIGNHLISLGDSSDGEQGISLLVEFETVDELNAAYKILADGAKIITPMNDTSYCTGYASLIDKFGIHWDLMSGYVG